MIDEKKGKTTHRKQKKKTGIRPPGGRLPSFSPRAMRRLLTYLRRDLREIVAPSSLPDPPTATTPNAAAHPRASALARAAQGSAAYFDTWRRQRDEDEKEAKSEDAPADGLTLTEDHRRAAVRAAATAARGADALKPALRALYETRVTAYKDAVDSFADGFREGVARGGFVGEAPPTLGGDPPDPEPPPPVKRKRGRPRKVRDE